MSTGKIVFLIVGICVAVTVGILLAFGIMGAIVKTRLDDQSYKVAATIQCRTLVQACEQFAANNNGLYPVTLQDLFDPQYAGVPYLKDDSILYVPWGNRQKYEYAPPRDANTKPHVWTVHPDGTLIGNPP